MAAVAGGRRQKSTTLRLRAQTPRKFHLPNIVNEDRFRIPGVDVNPINLECYPNKILYKPARLKRVSGSEGLSFHKMEEYLTSFSILLASLLLLFFLLPILFKNNSTAAIFWHTVLEEKVAMLMTGTSRENRILQYVMQNAVQGDAKSVVENIDKYCREKEWAMNVGDEKGAILDRVLEETNPSTVLELGTYCGYSALRIIRVLKPGARLMTVEFNPINADIARQIFHFAGVEEKVEILEGASQDIIPQLTRQHKVDTVDFVFLDHWKDRYQPDTQLLEECGLLRTGSVLLADNVISPGAPEFLQYVRNNPRYVCTHYASHLEYTTINDGMEKAIYKGPVCVKISER